jgi:hypothetical protein
MKTMNWVLSLLLLSAVFFTTSCTKDSEVPVDQPPTITLQVGADYTYQNTTVTVNTPLKVGIRALENATSGANLTNFTFTRTFNGQTNTYDTTFNSSSYQVDWLISANSQAGNETFIFTIKDKDGFTSNITIIITTTPITGEINTWSMKLLGAQASTTGSSFASIDGTVYSLANAKANANKVDWLYYYGATDLATIAAPNDANAKTVYNNATNGLQTWAQLNATTFKLITDAVDFDAITDDAVIVAQTASGVIQTRIPQLLAGKMIAFITQSGKKGILKVESITGTSDGTMTISVKVQK